jgi:hypothetical protein
MKRQIHAGKSCGSGRLACLACVASLIVLFACFGCGKDVDVFVPDPALDVTGDINRFFEAARKTSSVRAIVNIDFPVPVVTALNSVLIMQPGSLRDDSGNTVTGQVNVSILELLTAGEILLSGIPTHSRGLLMGSGAEMYITAEQNGQPLLIKQGMPVRILTDLRPGTIPEPRMELFYDLQEKDIFTGALYPATWEEADGNSSTWNNVDVTQWAAIADSQQIVTGYGYSCFPDRMGWINIGAFDQIPSADRTDVKITLPDGHNSVNTAVFLVFQDLNAVVRLAGSPGSTEFYNTYIPDFKITLRRGAVARLVVIVEQGTNNYYYAEVETTLKENHREYVIPAQTPFEEIVSSILSL